MADKPLKTWCLARDGKTVDTIVAEEVALKEGLAIFWTKNEQVAVVGLSGLVLRPAGEQDFINPRVEFI